MRHNFHIFILLSFILSIFYSCSTTVDLYLQKATQTKNESYGYSIDNPIRLKYSEKYHNNKIIESYVSRLSTYNLSSFNINSVELIPKDSALDKKKNNLFYKVNIESLDNSTRRTLYFHLNRSNSKIYVPYDLGFGYLSGINNKN